jgi:hypothetical protein
MVVVLLARRLGRGTPLLALPGVMLPVSVADVTAMDVIGYNVKAGVVTQERR